MPWILPDNTLVAVIPNPALATDPYGIDIAIDPTGDLRVTSSGSLGLVAGPSNCAQAVFLRLETQQGDLALHPDYGSQLPSQIGAKLQLGALVALLNAELQNLLATDARFARAIIVQAQTPAGANIPESVQFGVQAVLSGGEQITLGSTTDPTPVDVTLPQIVDPSADPTLMFDPTTELEFFADQDEIDSLTDLDTLATLVDDTTVPTTTGG